MVVSEKNIAHSFYDKDKILYTILLLSQQSAILLSRYGETRTLIQCWWECKLVQPLWKAVWRFLRKLEIELPYDPVILFLGIYPKEYKTGYNRDTCILMFITGKLWKQPTCLLFTIGKLWKQPRCPTTDE
jgi:hypothetical protein